MSGGDEDQIMHDESSGREEWGSDQIMTLRARRCPKVGKGKKAPGNFRIQGERTEADVAGPRTCLTGGRDKKNRMVRRERKQRSEEAKK